ncbi:hypothetical protein Bequi_13505 [Brachybacterium sp. JHP9]|uniref:DUF7007 domain-containing protein n=1 Tax=Brachybacterium equifaecis TaxID=2910770 RepID=A0ABT0R365_9MICO|nr:hypothetical protein [Brachybacterium equifaecis]MCL6424381.1 hypothetical protein [Brachybacterium equifaecis]
MSTKISGRAASARESARKSDGKFGEQEHGRADGVSLGDASWDAGADDAPEPEAPEKIPGFAADEDRDFTQEANTDSGRPAWGAVNHVYDIAPGIAEVSCEGHGGVKLSPERNRLVPAPLRRPGGWYEEDCEYKIAVATFPSAFANDASENTHWKRLGRDGSEQDALADVRNWFPDEYEQATGIPVTAEQSGKVREREFAEKHKDSFRVTGASTAEREGYVSLTAKRESDGAETVFLMPKDQYDREREKLPSGTYGIPINAENTELDTKKIVEREAQKAERQKKWEERAARAQTEFWGNRDALTQREQDRLEQWERQLVRTEEGEIVTQAESFQREPVHSVQRMVDGTKVKWYANLLGDPEHSSYIREIPAVVAKAATVPDETHESTKRWIEEDRAEKKAERERAKERRSRWGW